MIYYDDIHVEWLADYVSKSGDSTELIAHIETGGKLTEPLRSL